MPRTIDTLFESVLSGGPLTFGVVHDYFGLDNDTDENILIVYSLYEGLIRQQGITRSIIENCFLTNRLDELIHKKYMHHSSEYYKEFCRKNIKIGITFYLPRKEGHVMVITPGEYYEEITILNKNYQTIIDNYIKIRKTSLFTTFSKPKSKI